VILKIIKAIREKVLFYRIKRFIRLKIGFKKELNDYSLQIYEEKMLFALLDCLNIDNFFQIGIGDPDLNRDPFYNYLKKKKINGSVIEPHPILFQKLKNYYDGCLKINCLIGSKDNAQEEFFYVDQKYLYLYEDFVKTISTTNKNHLIENKVLPDHVKSIKIRSHTIKKVMEDNNIKNFDILFLDVEGSEFDILSQFLNNTNFFPSIIFEWRHLPQKNLFILLDKMKDNFDYKFVIFENDILCFKESNLKND